MSERMSKEQLLASIRSERAALDATVAKLSEEQVVEYHPGEWSAKDTLAHLVAWERHMLRRLRGMPPEFTLATPDMGLSDADVDRINAEFYLASRDRSLDDVRAEYRRSLGEVLMALGALTEEELNSTGRFPWLADRPLWQFVAVNTFEHYPEHRETIQRRFGVE